MEIVLREQVCNDDLWDDCFAIMDNFIRELSFRGENVVANNLTALEIVCFGNDLAAFQPPSYRRKCNRPSRGQEQRGKKIKDDFALNASRL